MNPHQSANQAVPMMAVMAVEINNESAASLIQSVTVHNFQSAPLPGVGFIAGCPSCVVISFVMLWPFARHGVAIFHRCLIVDR
jgi:hypothetical protein